MPSSVKLSMMGFEIDLKEIVDVIRGLVRAGLDQATKEAIKTLIAEVRKNFDVVVNVITPLYKLSDEVAVQAEFPSLYSDFKNVRIKNSNEVLTSCKIVTQQIDELKQGQAWKKGWPVFHNSLERLVDSRNKWVIDDNALAARMENFLVSVDGELGGVNAQIKDPVSAYGALQSFLKETEPELLKMKKQLDELRILSAKM